MKICIDLSAGVHHRAGLGRYATELLTALVALDTNNHYSLFYNNQHDASVPAALAHLPARVMPLSDKAWRLQTLVAHTLRRPQDRQIGSTDIFHATDNVLPYMHTNRTVFTLHDLIFQIYPTTHTRLNRWYLTLMMPLFLRRADHIIAVSKATARDAIKFYNLDKRQITVIPEGVSQSFQPITGEQVQIRVRKQYGLPERYVLFVGTIEPRKNLSTLLHAFAMQPMSQVKLVIIGKKGWLYQQTLELIDALELRGRVHFTGFIPDEDLPAVYSMADTFVFPSLYEGFGLPVLEAMACGTPVITSNVSSLPEITGDAALLVDPLNVDEISVAIRRLAEDASLRQELSQRGLRQASQFSWQRTAAQTLDVYQYALEKRTGFAKTHTPL